MVADKADEEGCSGATADEDNAVRRHLSPTDPGRTSGRDHYATAGSEDTLRTCWEGPIRRPHFPDTFSGGLGWRCVGLGTGAQDPVRGLGRGLLGLLLVPA